MEIKPTDHPSWTEPELDEKDIIEKFREDKEEAEKPTFPAGFKF